MRYNCYKINYTYLKYTVYTVNLYLCNHCHNKAMHILDLTPHDYYRKICGLTNHVKYQGLYVSVLFWLFNLFLCKANYDSTSYLENLQRGKKTLKTPDHQKTVLYAKAVMPIPKEATCIFLTSYTCTLMNALGICPNPMMKRSKGLQRNPITCPEFNMQSAWSLF